MRARHQQAENYHDFDITLMLGRFARRGRRIYATYQTRFDLLYARERLRLPHQGCASYASIKFLGYADGRSAALPHTAADWDVLWLFIEIFPADAGAARARGAFLDVSFIAASDARGQRDGLAPLSFAPLADIFWARWHRAKKAEYQSISRLLPAIAELYTRAQLAGQDITRYADLRISSRWDYYHYRRHVYLFSSA